MKNASAIIFCIVIVLNACRKDPVVSSPVDYPTIIYQLSEDEFQKRKAEYLAENVYIRSGLDQFGFCGFDNEDGFRDIEYPSVLTMTESEATAAVREFISKNKEALGVNNPNEIVFAEIRRDSSPSDHSIGWLIQTNNQILDSIPVYSTSISFHLRHGEVSICIGNWYPFVYVPEKLPLGVEDAKRKLENMVLYHYGYSGDYYPVTITALSLQNSTTRMVILPDKNEERIVLYVAWEIIIPSPVYYEIYIDAVTGKVVHQEPTIVG